MRNEEEFKKALTNDIDLFRDVLRAVLSIDSLHEERAEAIAHDILSHLFDEPLQVGIILDRVTDLMEDRAG